MSYRTKHTENRPYGIVVKVGYSPELREYRCRLSTNGKAHEPADYFTNDKADALATAATMANDQYRKRMRIRAAAISPQALDALCSVAWRVWQYIGSDYLELGDTDNEAAVECCFDADRPLTCANGKPDVAAHELCKAAFAEYGFDAVVHAVAAKVQFV